MKTLSPAHSPAPFHLGRAAGDLAIYGPKGEHIATLPDMLPKEERLANARLFIAAPKMLAALAACVRAIDLHGELSDKHREGAEIDAVRAAMAAMKEAGETESGSQG